MTDQEAREKYPNIAKLADFVSQQDYQTQCAALLLIAAAGVLLMDEEDEPV